MKRFDIMIEFLKGISFESPNYGLLFQGWEKGAAGIDSHTDVQICSSHENFHVVDLYVRLHSAIEAEEKTMFNVAAVYSALVRIDNIENAEEIQQILLIDVATVLFLSVKPLIEQLVLTSGYPAYRMSLPDFHGLYVRKQEAVNNDDKENMECEEKVCDGNCRFNFEQFVEEIRAELPKEDIENYEKVCGALPEKFEDLIFFKNYLRFFKPVKFQIPEKFEADDVNWDILFRLLAGCLSYEYRINIEEDGSASLPTLLYKTDSKNSTWNNISDMQGCLKILIDDLLVNSMSAALSLYKENIVSIDTVFAENLTSDKIPTWCEFLHLYGVSDENSEAAKTLKMFHDKLKEYDLKMFQIRSRNEINEIFV